MQNERRDRDPPRGSDFARILLPPSNGKHGREITMGSCDGKIDHQSYLILTVIIKTPTFGNGVRVQRKMWTGTITSLLTLCAPPINEFSSGTHFFTCSNGCPITWKEQGHLELEDLISRLLDYASGNAHAKIMWHPRVGSWEISSWLTPEI